MFEVTKARTAVGVLIAAAVAAPGAGAMPTDHTPPAAANAAGATDARGGYSFEAAPAPAPAAPGATRIVEVRSSRGFDWGDAGLGAAATLSLLGLGTGAVVVARRNRPSLG